MNWKTKKTLLGGQLSFYLLVAAEWLLSEIFFLKIEFQLKNSNFEYFFWDGQSILI